jgi:hypothetical protein
VSLHSGHNILPVVPRLDSHQFFNPSALAEYVLCHAKPASTFQDGGPMFLNTLLRLPLPVVLALGALMLLAAVMARVVAGLRRPVVVRVPARPATRIEREQV